MTHFYARNVEKLGMGSQYLAMLLVILLFVLIKLTYACLFHVMHKATMCGLSIVHVCIMSPAIIICILVLHNDIIIAPWCAMVPGD